MFLHLLFTSNWSKNIEFFLLLSCQRKSQQNEGLRSTFVAQQSMSIYIMLMFFVQYFIILNIRSINWKLADFNFCMLPSNYKLNIQEQWELGWKLMVQLTITSKFNLQPWTNSSLEHSIFFSPYLHTIFLRTILRYCDKKILR